MRCWQVARDEAEVEKKRTVFDGTGNTLLMEGGFNMSTNSLINLLAKGGV